MLSIEAPSGAKRFVRSGVDLSLPRYRDKAAGRSRVKAKSHEREWALNPDRNCFLELAPNRVRSGKANSGGMGSKLGRSRSGRP